MWPTNWLGRFCTRPPPFSRIQHCVEAGQAGLKRLHSLVHCHGSFLVHNDNSFRGTLDTQIKMRDTQIQLTARRLLSVLALVSTAFCALFTPLFWPQREQSRAVAFRGLSLVMHRSRTGYVRGAASQSLAWRNHRSQSTPEGLLVCYFSTILVLEKYGVSVL